MSELNQTQWSWHLFTLLRGNCQENPWLFAFVDTALSVFSLNLHKEVDKKGYFG